MSDESGYTAAAGEGVFSPGNDLTAQLLAARNPEHPEVEVIVSGEMLTAAADRIEALEAEKAALTEAALDHRATASRALGREQEARAVIAEALGEFVTHMPVRSLDGPIGDYWLREADAVLAVLVPADQVRAEALEAAADKLTEITFIGSANWLRARAAEYRKAAGA